MVEAFDAMTTDHVYRPAMSQERAMVELFHCAGTQFDPELVRQFVEFREGDAARLPPAVASRWLRDLDPRRPTRYWDFTAAGAARRRPPTIALFQAKLLDNMYDAVVFVDAAGRIKLWNHGAERLTGIAGGHGLPAAVEPGHPRPWPTRRGSPIADGRLPGPAPSRPACSRCGG